MSSLLYMSDMRRSMVIFMIFVVFLLGSLGASSELILGGLCCKNYNGFEIVVEKALLGTGTRLL